MSQAIVEQAKADLIERGLSFDQAEPQARNDAAFLIVLLAASRIPGAGVVAKPAGNHAVFRGERYAVDGIMFRDGRFFDCLIAAGDPTMDGYPGSRPTWGHTDTIDPSRWRTPFPDGSVEPPEGPPQGSTGETLDKLGPDVRASLGRVEQRQRLILAHLGIPGID